MLIFGASVSDWQEKADYAEDKADNEFAEVREIRCEGIDDVQTAMAAMAAFAVPTKCKDFLYHATINLKPGERLSRAQWQRAVETLEKNLKLTGHHRVIFEHIKKDRQHYHIYWSRIPPSGKGAATNMGNNYYTHQNTAKGLEKEFGLKQAPRSVDVKTSKNRQEINDRNSRIRVNPNIVTAEVTKIFRDSRTTKAFISNLSKAGYTLTRNKRGRYVLVDKNGGYHGLLRRINNAKLDDVRQKFPELDKTPLPSLGSVLRNRKPPSVRNFRQAAFLFTAPVKRYSKLLARSPQFRNFRSQSNGLKSTNPIFSKLNQPALKAYLRLYTRIYGRSRTPHFGFPFKRGRRSKKDENIPDSEKMPFRRPEWEAAALLAWAAENGRVDILAEFGIIFSSDMPEP